MSPTTKHILALSVLALALAPLASCNIATTASYVIQGPPKVPAQYELDNERATVVFIDDRSSKVPRRSLRVVMGQFAEEDMIANRVIDADKMIAAQSILRAAMTEDADEPMSVADLGQAVTAEVVVYVAIDAWTLSKDGGSYSPLVATRVKVIDAEARARIWPSTDRGHPLIVEPAQSASDVPRSSAERNAAHTELAERVGRSIAKLFYTSEREAVRDR